MVKLEEQEFGSRRGVLDMKRTLRTLLLGTAAAVALGASDVQASAIDLSGVVLDPGFGGGGNDPIILNHVETKHGPLSSIWFDLDYTANAPSWGSEVNILLTHSESGFTYFADASVLFGWGSDGNWTTMIDVIIPEDVPADIFGNWTVSIFDDLNDGGVVDGMFNDGSQIKLHPVAQVPEPGTLALFGVGLAGLAWLVRRRRSV